MLICEEDRCTGCGACSVICPKHCIKIITDADGFYYPKINQDKCIGCSKCIKNCPINSRCVSSMDHVTEAFSFIHRDANTLSRSSSGGAFMALAEKVISDGGYVFGAVYDKNFNVVMNSAKTLKELTKMQGSKYVEAYVGDTYIRAKEYLDEGAQVLYSGTPCKIAGLYAYLKGKKYLNLITIEILCHGVPSNKLFRSYLEFINWKYGKVIGYSFRDKAKWGWGAWGSFKYIKNGKSKERYFPARSDYYYSLFYSDNCFRESCYNCKFASEERIADITVGDCWGIEEIMPSSRIQNGVSVIIVNSELGRKALFNAVDASILTQLDIEWVRKNNANLVRPTKRPERRTNFYKDFNNEGFVVTAKKYVKIQHILPFVARYIPREFKIKAKKVLHK